MSRRLGELKAGVHANSVAQLVAQDALFAVVGQLEQVEACRRSGKSTAGLLLANGEEPSENAAQGVSSVLEGPEVVSSSASQDKACQLRTQRSQNLHCSTDSPSLTLVPGRRRLPHSGWRKVV